MARTQQDTIRHWGSHTALSEAVKLPHSNIEAIKTLLLQYGADINTTTDCGDMGLHQAIRSGLWNEGVWWLPDGASVDVWGPRLVRCRCILPFRTGMLW